MTALTSHAANIPMNGPSTPLSHTVTARIVTVAPTTAADSAEAR